MNWFLLLVAAVATWQIVEIWHHSLLFANARSYVELMDNRIGELLTCPFCLSNWVGLICVIFLQDYSDYTFQTVFSTLIFSFAAARLSNLFNDLCKQITLTPKGLFDDRTAGEQ